MDDQSLVILPLGIWFFLYGEVYFMLFGTLENVKLGACILV